VSDHSREGELAHTTVHLVRHGHVIWTPDEDRVLSPEGRAGAEHVSSLLAGEPISAVYASTMRRAIQTVEPLARSLALPVTTLEALRERRLSGGPVDDHDNLLALILQHWFPSVDHAFWSRLSMPDIYTLTLRDEGPRELARRWDAGSRFVSLSGEGKEA
jgi:2,3-bisphosphoglycerate-dependent phosphoglycerate mutase